MNIIARYNENKLQKMLDALSVKPLTTVPSPGYPFAPMESPVFNYVTTAGSTDTATSTRGARAGDLWWEAWV